MLNYINFPSHSGQHHAEMDALRRELKDLKGEMKQEDQPSDEMVPEDRLKHVHHRPQMMVKFYCFLVLTDLARSSF